MELTCLRHGGLAEKTGSRNRWLLPAATLAAGVMMVMILGVYLQPLPPAREVSPAPVLAGGSQAQTCLDPLPKTGICPPAQGTAPPAMERRARLAARRCALGRWLHGPLRRLAGEGSIQLRGRSAALEKQHLDLHRAALVVEAYLARGDRHSAINHQRHYTLPLLEQMVQSLTALQKEIDQVCRKEKNPVSCSRKFAILYTNLGGAMCGLPHFSEHARDYLGRLKPPEGAALNATPASAR